LKNPWQKIFVALTFILLLTLTVFVQKQTTVKLSTENDLKADIELAPCKDKERLGAVKKLFSKMGADEKDISVEKFKNVENVVLTKKGETDETIVIGAHFDKTESGCGVIDNWTGIVITAHLYQRIKDIKTNKTYKFVAFGKEELGLLGSGAMAREIPKEKIANYCAMINFDSFGFSFPQALGNASDESLINLAKNISKELEFPFADTEITGTNADSNSFRDVQIPAITLHGLSGNWQNYLHRSEDKNKNVDSQSVYAGYIFALKLIAKIDESSCSEYR
jgi:Zn-dependent M28 family amino/carboxypeptidase